MALACRCTVLVGIDWATCEHQVCALDPSRKILGQRRFSNTPEGINALVGWLLELADGDPTVIAVAIERPDGLVVEALLDQEIAVYAINPKQLDRFRDRFSPAGTKDDRRDALVLADALRSDSHAFRRVVPDPADVVRLRGLVREDDALRIEETALNNRLRDLLGRYYPQLLSLAADRVDPLLWDLWELAPTAAAAATLSQRAVAARLRQHRIRRLKVAAVMEILRGPAPRVSDATVEASVSVIRRLLPRLRLGHAQRQDCGRQIEALLRVLEAPPVEKTDQHSDAAILRSLPGVGRVVLARMLTEGAEAIRQRDLNRLRALGGSAPVTQRSGQTCHVLMRRACSGRLRYAYYHWARTAVQHDERSRAHYHQLRGRGQSHGRALRGVVDRLLNVAVAMLRTGTLYDPSRRIGGQTPPGQARTPGRPRPGGPGTPRTEEAHGH
jgi:transposase